MGEDKDNKNLSDLPVKTLLKPDDVAAFFGVSLKTVYRWHKQGLIAGVRIKRSLRISRDSIMDHMRDILHVFL